MKIMVQETIEILLKVFLLQEEVYIQPSFDGRSL